MKDLSKYIGLEYGNLGRGPDKFDCIGLILEIYKNELGIELPDYTELQYDEDWYKEHDHIVDNIDKKWIEVKEPLEMFDILIFFGGCAKGVANHIGLYAGNGRFIHISSQYSSMLSRLDKYWKSRLYKGLRYNG